MLLSPVDSCTAAFFRQLRYRLQALLARPGALPDRHILLHTWWLYTMQNGDIPFLTISRGPIDHYVWPFGNNTVWTVIHEPMQVYYFVFQFFLFSINCFPFRLPAGWPIASGTDVFAALTKTSLTHSTPFFTSKTEGPKFT